MPDILYVPEDERELTPEEKVLYAAILALVDGVVIEVRAMFATLRFQLQKSGDGADMPAAEAAVRAWEQEAVSLASGLNPLSLQIIGNYQPAPEGSSIRPVADPLSLDQQNFLIQQVQATSRRAVEGTRLAQTPGVAPGLILASFLGLREEGGIVRAFDTGSLRIMSSNTISSGRGIFPAKVAVPEIDTRTTPLCRNRMGWQVRALDEPFVDPKSGAAWMTSPFVYNGLPKEEEYHECRTVVLLRSVR